MVALTFLQAPNELFFRFAFSDSGTSLTIDDLVRRGFRPTIDFGYIYGLLPLLINRIWFAVLGASPGSCWWAILVCNVALAWGLARFAAAQRVGWVGVALLALAMPDLLRSSYDVLVQALEPALLVHALAEQARAARPRPGPGDGRRLRQAVDVLHLRPLPAGRDRPDDRSPGRCRLAAGAGACTGDGCHAGPGARGRLRRPAAASTR